MYIRLQISLTTYDIGCSVVYGTDWHDKRLNHTFLRTSDGTPRSFDIGPTLAKTVILMKNVSYADVNILRSFIRSSCIFSSTQFDVIQLTNAKVAFPSGEGVDLGNGLGVTLSDASYFEEDTDGLARLVPPGLYDVTLPVEYVRP